ncbi:MAG TPA: NUDIX hydrolase [Actinomycetota bacterium]|jgi:8-oxo-dGTP pyrophosphatase MutT (NUDIX family)
MKTRNEFSSGGVVFKKTPGGPEVALASRRTKRGDLAWGLPKGAVEEGEEPPETAVREVEEETGLVAEIREPLGDISYWYVWDGQRIRKRVSFFLMEAVGGDTSKHDHEMEEIRWFPLPEALQKASYRGEQDVIRKAATALGLDA